MVLWIVLGAIVLAVLILLGAGAVLGRRLRPLERATRRLRLRGEQAQRLQVTLAELQSRVEALGSAAEEAVARAEALRARRPV